MYRLSSLSSREQFTTWFGQRDDWKLRVTNERSERFPRERRRYVKRACFTDLILVTVTLIPGHYLRRPRRDREAICFAEVASPAG
jgi:hypothetical protein